MAGWGEDLRFALRLLRKRPGASAAAITALAVGIGFNSATYSIADVLLYRPLPAPGIERAVVLFGSETSRPEDRRSVSPVDYADWRETLRSVDHVSAARHWEANLTGAGEPEGVVVWRVTPDFFSVMELAPRYGRLFHPDEGMPGRGNVVVLSHQFWAQRFGMDPRVIGREFELDGAKHTVIGVMPEGFRYPDAAQMWVPLAFSGDELAAHGNFYIRTLARLKPGATLEQLNAELDGFGRRFARSYPSSHKGLRYGSDWLRDNVSGKLTSLYTSLTLASVGFLLLIACINVANLQFARALTRGREMAIRGALGAGRWRLVRQSLLENLLLAAAGAGLGLLVAQWSLELLRAGMPPEVERYLPGWYRLGLNGPVLGLTAVVAIASGVLAGIGPALWMSRRFTAAQLQDVGSRGSTSSRSRQWTRNAMVAAQVALTAILLVGASLLARGFESIARLDVKADPSTILTMTVAQPESRYKTPESVRDFQERLMGRIANMPGVVSSAMVTNLPYSGSTNATIVQFRGRQHEIGLKNLTQTQSCSPGYFRTLGIPLLSGRDFSDSDGPGTQPVAIVSEAFVRRFFPDGSEPIGRQFNIAGGDWIAIVGVSGDVLHHFVDREPKPLIYQPYRQVPRSYFNLAIRASGDPLALVPAMRALVHELDPAQPLADVRTFAKVISDSLTGMSYITSVMGVFAAVALFLSLLGVYGLTSYSAAERTREFGVRLALGATRGSVLWLVLGRGLILSGAGLVIGWPVSVLLARRISGLFYGVSAGDSATLIGVPISLVLAALAACLFPAWRATRTDPLQALHHE